MVETRTEKSDAFLLIIQYEINPQQLDNNCVKYTLLNLRQHELSLFTLADRLVIVLVRVE